ncbi:16165_t:CDS:1 [Acaulospora colombiana]|uniref:16165_t:CDS:1 n=1 Tax=Acaulospora colombiana TaxID=27376 RepID=A0ACA9JW39_9GLOM|nr:16165_t:CDS:1 [Acaulospora colombiana]
MSLMIDNPNYSDIKIICGDAVSFNACSAILAARSETFSQILCNYDVINIKNRELHFRMISGEIMRFILEFIYTGKLNGETERYESDVEEEDDEEEYDFLNVDNVFELYIAADYFQMVKLQEIIVDYLKKVCKHEGENIAPELLTSAVKHMRHILDDDTTIPSSPSLSKHTDNEMKTLLLDTVSRISLDKIKFGRLSLNALEYLLKYTYPRRKYLNILEYLVLRYALLLSARSVSKDAFISLENRLPISNNIKRERPRILDRNDTLATFSSVRNSISDIVTPLLEYIAFRKIDGNILKDLIEPLGIIKKRYHVGSLSIPRNRI